MKEEDDLRGKFDDLAFISHMVQMKGIPFPALMQSYTWLYIPHGSDERSSYISKDELSRALYIPHGSDES